MNPDSPVRSLLSQAQHLISIHRPEQATSLLAQALASDPTNPSIHRLLSLSMVQLGRYKDALNQADTAIHLDPENEWSFRLRSVALLSLGKRRIGPAAFLSRRTRRAGLAAAKE